MPHCYHPLNVNADSATSTAQTVVLSETVGRLVQSGIAVNSDLNKVVNMLPRGNQAETTSATSKFMDCASDNSSCPLSNTSVAMSSFSTEYNTEHLPSVDTPDACDKAANR